MTRGSAARPDHREPSVRLLLCHDTRIFVPFGNSIEGVNSSMSYRPYDAGRDREAAYRLYQEIGWLKAGQELSADLRMESGHAIVADVRGEAECLATTAPGTLRYLENDLACVCVTGVSTSQIARRQGFARSATALVVAANVADGALVAVLGVFDQGFYDQLGFGSGPYEHVIAFDPAELKVRVRPRVPRRLKVDDWEAVHAARLARARSHGSLNIDSPQWTHGRMILLPNGLGLGFSDERGNGLGHHFWGVQETVGYGPLNLDWFVFDTRDQFLELLAVLKSLGDQVRLVRMREPPGIQMQDLISHPLRLWLGPGTANLNANTSAVSYWQMRICDLPGCMAETNLGGEKLRFNLTVTDPIERFLEPNAPWRGVGGKYVVTLGPTSSAELGRDQSLPTLRASVGAFTRVWLGVRPATGLALTDELDGPPELLRGLDRALRLPEPRPDWDF